MYFAAIAYVFFIIMPWLSEHKMDPPHRRTAAVSCPLSQAIRKEAPSVCTYVVH